MASLGSRRWQRARRARTSWPIAALATALAAGPCAARAEDAITSASLGPAYAQFHTDAASTARGLQFEIHMPGPGNFEWSARCVVASSNVTYRPATRPVHSMFLLLSGGLTLRPALSSLVIPWLGASLAAQVFETDPQLFAGYVKGSQSLLGIGPAAAVGLDISTRPVGVRVAMLTTYMPEVLANSAMAGIATLLSVQLSWNARGGDP